MSEERFDRLEKMMTDLMRMVGANNAELSKLSARVDTIEIHLAKLTENVHVLDARVGALESKFNALETKVGTLDAKFDALNAKVDKNHQEVMETIGIINDKIGLLAERELHNRAEITALKRAR